MTSLRRAWRTIPGTGLVTDRAGGRFLVFSAGVGVAVGLGAAALIELMQLVGRLGEGLGLAGGSAWVFLSVPLGITTAWALARSFAPEVEGDGVPEAMAALAVRGGFIRGRVAPLKIAATSLTVGLGGSAGREGPIVHIGASIGSKVARALRLGEDQVRSLVAAGAGAGVGAAFNAPIAGMLFALEVILGSFAVRHVSAIVVASVAAAVTSQSLVGAELALAPATLALGDPRELLLYAGLAAVIVLAALLFLNLVDRADSGARSRLPGPARPIVMGLVVAAFIYLEPRLTGDGIARLFGDGQEVTNALLMGSTATQAWWALVVVALGKVVVTSLTLAAGGSGGAFMPSLFIGATLGTAFARVVEPWWDISTLEPAAFAVVGMAAMFSAMARAPLTAILLVFEVTGTREYGLILPLMLAAILATFVTERFHRDSVYTMPLRKQGIALTRTGEVDILDTITVGQVMAKVRYAASPSTDLAEVRQHMDRVRNHGVPVVDGEGELCGIVTATDIIRAGGPSPEIDVASAMTHGPVTVTPTAPVSQALARMAALGVGRLPVVDEHHPGRLVGMFRREDAVRAYHEALGSRTDHHLVRARLEERTRPDAGYFDFRVPPGSIADGKAVKEVAWPEGSTLVSVRRGREVIVPSGDTVLVAADLVTAFGNGSAERATIDRLNAGADEPTAEITLDDLVPVREEPDPSPTLEGPRSGEDQ